MVFTDEGSGWLQRGRVATVYSNGKRQSDPYSGAHFFLNSNFSTSSPSVNSVPRKVSFLSFRAESAERGIPMSEVRGVLRETSAWPSPKKDLVCGVLSLILDSGFSINIQDR